MPDDPWKIKWDLFIALLIIVQCVTTPISLAFFDVDDQSFEHAENSMNAIFFIDIIFTFRSAYFDRKDKLIDNLRKIAMSYLKFWFWLDFLSIIPISYIL